MGWTARDLLIGYSITPQTAATSLATVEELPCSTAIVLISVGSEAQPGDLAFYPEDEHIGIVGGRDEDGNLLVIHCASGSLNNVVITGASGFVAIATPQFYGEE